MPIPVSDLGLDAPYGRWTHDILRVLWEHDRETDDASENGLNFATMQRRMLQSPWGGHQITRKTLTERLLWLRSVGIVENVGAPLKVGYVLTERGKELYHALNQLLTVVREQDLVPKTTPWFCITHNAWEYFPAVDPRCVRAKPAEMEKRMRMPSARSNAVEPAIR
jgi:DNA-binding HxlR family transcriptional regulator